jgi:hypothetical protein
MTLTDAVRDWFMVEVPGIAGSRDNLPEGAPHRSFAVRFSGGLGTQLEDRLDRPTFALYVRGVNGGDAELWGAALDRAFIDAESMLQMGDYYIRGKGRFGGPPSYVGLDSSEIYPGRVVRSATYWLRLVRWWKELGTDYYYFLKGGEKMADENTVRLAPVGAVWDSYTPEGGPVIERASKGGTEVPAKDADKIMAQAASEGVRLRKLEDDE